VSFDFKTSPPLTTIAATNLLFGADSDLAAEPSVYEVSALSASGIVRDLLKADRTYYVSTTGSNANDGLTSGTAWATLQFAWDTIAGTLDQGQFIVTIQCAAGTYAAPLNGTSIPTGTVDIIGDEATPANCIVVADGNAPIISAFVFIGQVYPVFISGFTTSAINGGQCIVINNCHLVACGAIAFTSDSNADSIAISISTSSVLIGISPDFSFVYDISLSGDWSAYIVASSISNVSCFASSFTLTGTPNWTSSGVTVDGVSQLSVGTAFVGSATGVRFETSDNSAIQVFGAGLSFLPGDQPGMIISGATYDNFNPVNLYTVATLPSGSPEGMIAGVTDALAPVSLSPVVGGGSVHCTVYFDGTNWVADAGGAVSVTADASGATLAATDSGKTFTNEGASGLAVFNLPTAAASLIYSFIVENANGIKAVANTGDTIRIATAVSASAGNAQSTTIGSTLTLVSINATEWMATSTLGTWSVT
jgi:hypothetical protein